MVFACSGSSHEVPDTQSPVHLHACGRAWQEGWNRCRTLNVGGCERQKERHTVYGRGVGVHRDRFLDMRGVSFRA